MPDPLRLTSPPGDNPLTFSQDKTMALLLSLLAATILLGGIPTAAEAGPAKRLARQLGISRSEARRILAAPPGGRTSPSVSPGTAVGPALPGAPSTTLGVPGFGSVGPAQ